jgi:hypothetical protein
MEITHCGKGDNRGKSRFGATRLRVPAVKLKCFASRKIRGPSATLGMTQKGKKAPALRKDRGVGFVAG